MTEYTPPFIAFLGAYPKVFLSFHLLGVIIGMGSATVADIFFFKFMQDFRFSRKEVYVLNTLSDIIVIALIVIILSGLALYLPAYERYNQSGPFLAKMVITGIVCVNGLLMHRFIAPHMIELSFVEDPREHYHVLQRLRKIAFAMGSISFTSWYSVFFIATLKTLVPPEVRFTHILSIYGSILFMAIVTSQVMEFLMRRKSTRLISPSTTESDESSPSPGQVS